MGANLADLAGLLRNRSLCRLACIFIAVTFVATFESHGTGASEDSVLPQGDARPALVSPYFPDRVHEFIWRNWKVVTPVKLAQILGTSERNVAAIAGSMGLPPAAGVPPEMLRRGYATIIR